MSTEVLFAARYSMKNSRVILYPCRALAMCLSAVAFGAGSDEFTVKREQVFEFAGKPTVQVTADRVTIGFESKGFCDATVAIEDKNGRIVRHLACGVLGEKAPPPFQRNSKKQTLVWDGKDDAGVYVDDRSSQVVRVSLGLKPLFERTLFWSPHKRIGFEYPVLCASPEGVYVAEGYAVDHVRLFDHDGAYVRTVYPFPADKVKAVDGLEWHDFRQVGRRLPLKRGYHQATLLTCGSNTNSGGAAEGYGVNAMASGNGHLALLHRRLNRLRPDGSSGGMPLEGPATAVSIPANSAGWGHPDDEAAPLSAAFSPDGRRLYLAGYQFTAHDQRQRSWLNGVARIQYAGNEPPQLFAGNLKPGEANGGTEDGQFRAAASVDVDAKGRVYVADFMNDRIQVFDENGKHLKSIAVSKPACVAIHRRTGDIFVFSWLLQNRWITVDDTGIQPTYYHMGTFENPTVKVKCPLPLELYNSKTAWNYLGGVQHRVVLDSWTERPTLWIVNGASGRIGFNDDGSFRDISETWDRTSVEIFEEVDGKLDLKRRFRDEVEKSVLRLKPPILWRQRLYVNPANGRLYVAEGDSGVMKSVNQLVEIDPDRGRIRLVDLPMGSEDLCFDLSGRVYLRTDTVVARYDPKTWREIPWDYGEEYKGHSFGMGARGADLQSGLPTPGHRSFNFWHLGGMDVSVKGHLVVTTCNGSSMTDKPKWMRGEAHFDYQGGPYVPQVYPGRLRWGEIHIWDRHGKLIYEDAAPGMAHLNGIGIDGDDNLYMMTASRRLLEGEAIDAGLARDVSGTLVKAPPRSSKTLDAGSRMVPVPLSEETKPKRPIELKGYNTGWVEGAEWLYGGVGFSTPGGCVCWNTRFDLDYFGRSFAPEPHCYSVAVLDSAGNLVLRVGTYGNVDDGRPLVTDGPSTGSDSSRQAGSGQGGPENPRSIGGDEVALAHACYVATDTDRRLFIADAGNARILSVRLGYYAEERAPLDGTGAR